MKKDKLICRCGGEIVPSKKFYEGFLLDCMRCNRCGEESFTLKQTKDILELKELSQKIKGVERKITTVGNSIGVSFPKRLEAYGVRKGMRVKVRMLSPKIIGVELKKPLV